MNEETNVNKPSPQVDMKSVDSVMDTFLIMLNTIDDLLESRKSSEKSQ